MDGNLSIEYRYLVAVVRKDTFSIGGTKELDEIKWSSLQTRTLADWHDLKVHLYIPRRIPDLDKKISLTSSNDKVYTYKTEGLPIKISLLSKSNSGADYAQTGTVVPALETYSTIVSWEE